MDSGRAFVNGELLPRSQATVSIDDASVRYGAACFETMRATNGRVFRLAAHLDRLRAGLQAMRVTPPSVESLTAAVTATLEANQLTEARVRLSVSAGPMLGPHLTEAGPPTTIVVTDPVPVAISGAMPDAAPSPIALAISSLRVDPGRPLAAAKTAQYLIYLLARAEARDVGADDALLLDPSGDVCETAIANLFAVIDRRLVTPALTSGPLPGVTRSVLLEIADRERLPVDQRALPLEQLTRATEIFVTNSIVGVQPVSSIARDGETLWRPDAAPQVTPRLAARYADLLAAECGDPR
jgi:branched-chain amino acid aminotransferase